MAVYNEKDKKKWTKDGRHWYFRKSYRDFNNNIRYYKSKMYASKNEAEQEELLYITKRDNPVKVKFSVVADDYFKYMYKTRKESTVYTYESNYRTHLKGYFERFYINDIDIHMISKWKSEMEKAKLSVKYLNSFYNILKGIFDFAIKNYGLESNPIQIAGRFENRNDKIVEDNKKIRYITLEDFNKFISVIDDEIWKTFFIFLFYTGMRKGEVQALTWKDIDFQNNEIIINKTLSIKTQAQYKITTTKNYINRRIKMNKTLRESLLNYKKNVKKYSDYKDTWFVFGNTRFLPQTNMDRFKDYYFKKAKMEDKRITLHEFRHSHVSLLINEYVKKSKERNMKIDTAKFFLMMSNRMGHSIEVMQETYMHLFPTIQDEIVDLLDNL